MSKIARKPIIMPEQTKFSINENQITIEGPKGKLSFQKQPDIVVKEESGKIHIATSNDSAFEIQNIILSTFSNLFLLSVTELFITGHDFIKIIKI